jgi:hypothetical protein
MHPDGLITPPLVGLPISGEEPPLGLPAGAPLDLGQLPGVTVHAVAELGESPAPPTHRHLPCRDPPLDLCQPGL